MFFAYFDFKTNTGSGSRSYLDDEERYLISYILFIAFHPKLDIERIVALRRFQQTLEEISDNGYLNCKMIEKVVPVATNQLRYCTIKVFEKKNLQFQKCFIVS